MDTAVKLSNDTEQKVRALLSSGKEEEELTSDILDIIYKEDLFKLFVPDNLGGKSMALPDALRIFEEASRIDGTFGWLVTIGSGGNFFSAFVKPETAKKLFSPEKAIVSGSGSPTGKAIRTKGGYNVTGRWKYCSGSTYATLFTVNCILDDGKSPEDAEIRTFILLPDEVKIIKDWTAIGLKATDSHSIEVDNIFVPDERVFDIFSTDPNYDDPIYRYPFRQFAEAGFASVCIGICRHFLEEAKAMSQRKKEVWHATLPGRYGYVTGLIKQKEAQLEKDINLFYEAVNDSWEPVRNNQGLSEKDFEGYSNQFKYTARTSLTVAQDIFRYLGMSAILEDRPINKIWRDLHTASQHIFLVLFD